MKKNFIKLFAVLAGGLVMVGCSAMTLNFGSIIPDQGVEKNFEAYQIDPGLNYYFSGSESYPTVIMGLKKQYVLDNGLWRPLAPDPKRFKDLITDMQIKAHEVGKMQHGFVIKSPDGQALGVWYSPFISPLRVKMGEGNKVVVHTPDPSSYPYNEGFDYSKVSVAAENG